MKNYTILIVAFLVLIFIIVISRKRTITQTKKETFRVYESPHLLRRLGLSPTYCPFRDQY